MCKGNNRKKSKKKDTERKRKGKGNESIKNWKDDERKGYVKLT